MAYRDHLITTMDQLQSLYGERLGASVVKEIDHINDAYRKMIEVAPFVAVATSGPEGLDCSPKGDAPGFVRILDDKTLAIPDRPGNNRIDGFRNIIRDPRIALLFLIPGVGETLRVNGRAHVPETGGALLVPNHVSFVDGLLIIASLDRPVRFIVDAAFFGRPIVGSVLRALGAIPISASGGPKVILRAFRDAGKHLDEGHLVCIFAEGQITRTGIMNAFRRGLQRLAWAFAHRGRGRRACTRRHRERRARAACDTSLHGPGADSLHRPRGNRDRHPPQRDRYIRMEVVANIGA